MKNKFEKIQDFVNSLEAKAMLGEEQSLLLVGGNGMGRSTAFNDADCHCGGGGVSNNCSINTPEGCTNMLISCVNSAHGCSDAQYGACPDRPNKGCL